jgi:hypothetical protein
MAVCLLQPCAGENNGTTQLSCCLRLGVRRGFFAFGIFIPGDEDYNYSVSTEIIERRPRFTPEQKLQGLRR